MVGICIPAVAEHTEEYGRCWTEDTDTFTQPGHTRQSHSGGCHCLRPCKYKTVFLSHKHCLSLCVCLVLVFLKFVLPFIKRLWKFESPYYVGKAAAAARAALPSPARVHDVFV